jgi:hypothetical protein
MLGLVGRGDDWRWLGDILAEDVSLDEPRKPDGQFMVNEIFRWDGENLCDMLDMIRGRIKSAA